MVDPWTALERIRGLMKSDGTLLVSLPNVRNFRVVLPLLMGKWTYRESGLLDQTHLRFFTRSSARELVEEYIAKYGHNDWAIHHILSR